MADVARLLTRHAVSAVTTPSAGAASQTVVLGYGDANAVLVVNNRNATAIRAHVAAGDGLRKDLGELNVDIAANSIAAIPFTDSARFKVTSTGKATVTLTDTANTALTATPLAAIEVALIQG